MIIGLINCLPWVNNHLSNCQGRMYLYPVAWETWERTQFIGVRIPFWMINLLSLFFFEEFPFIFLIVCFFPHLECLQTLCLSHHFSGILRYMALCKCWLRILMAKVYLPRSLWTLMATRTPLDVTLDKNHECLNRNNDI